jgi:hypothetical protein
MKMIKMKRKNYKCQYCNKKISHSSFEYGNKGCCSCSAKNRFKNPKNHPRFKTGKNCIQHYCIICHKKISNNTKYEKCRHCCRSNKLSPTFNKKGKLHPAWKGGKSKCIDCGKQLNDYRNKRCRNCDSLYRSNKYNGKNHWNYINGLGYLPYSKTFTLHLKNSIRKRDNYTCQLCKMDNKEYLKKYNREIEIHHIDYNKYNDDKRNLITLCKQCNIKANYNRDYWFAYFSYLMEN